MRGFGSTPTSSPTGGSCNPPSPEIKSAKDAVDANKIALEGVQEEEKVGQRTTLDVLNAQLEYLTSQIRPRHGRARPPRRRIFAVRPGRGPA